MKITVFSATAAALLCLGSGLYAAGPDLTKGKDDLVAAMRQEIKDAGKAAANKEDTVLKKTAADRLEKTPVDDPQWAETLKGARPLFKSTGVDKAAGALNAAMEKQAKLAQEEEERQALISACQDLLTRAKQTIATGDAAALDATLLELERPFPWRQMEPDADTLHDQVDATKHYAFLWQSYLVAKKAGDAKTMKADLNDLLNVIAFNPGQFAGRSKLLELIQETDAGPGDPQQPVLEIQSLDQVAAAIAKLQAMQSMRNTGGGGAWSRLTEAQELLEQLGDIEKFYAQYKSGLPVPLAALTSSAGKSPAGAAAKLASLRAELLKLTVARGIEAPAGTEPSAEEAPIDFLTRIEGEAVEKEDLDLALRARRARIQMGSLAALSNDDLAGVAAYQSARQLEAAGQFPLAVASYERALKSGCALVPAKKAGERLEAIRSSRAADYEKGLKWYLNPAADEEQAAAQATADREEIRHLKAENEKLKLAVAATPARAPQTPAVAHEPEKAPALDEKAQKDGEEQAAPEHDAAPDETPGPENENGPEEKGR